MLQRPRSLGLGTLFAVHAIGPTLSLDKLHIRFSS
jgi:hypothetical protein